MAIYTKKGDRGETSLLGGKTRYPKDHQRIVAYGTVDELQAQLGFAESLMSEARLRLKQETKSIKAEIRKIQKDLFEIEAELATPPGQKPPFLFGEARTKELESLIDELEGRLPVLANFIFPGGTTSGAALHVARTIARRAEREVVRLARRGKVNPNILQYLNRLSDALFMLAREVNHLNKSPEKKWRGK